MNHLGDITKINGAEIAPVDVIIGGSPCQDLSVAGKRAGLAGARSGLFMEQIRIVKEMRNATNGTRPRFMVWENVPGAFSSNKGGDFAAVLEETIRVIEPEAPCVDVPERGWPTWGQYRDVGGRWSVAWRVLDAQYWGVPQRRRRIALIADFGGSAAGEILFNRKGVSRDSEPCGETREDAAAGTESGAGDSVWCLQGNGIDCADTAGCNGRGWRENQSYTLNTVDRPAVACLTPWDSQTARIYDEDGVFHTLNAGEKAGQSRDGVLCAYSFDSLASNSMKSKNPNSGCRKTDIAKTLDTSDARPDKNQGGMAIFDMSHANHVICECGEIVPTLLERMGTGGNQVPLTMRYRSFGDYETSEHASTLKARNTPDNSDVVCETRTFTNQSYGEYRESDIAGTCAQRDYKSARDLALGRFVRRLTPLECERLQGFPSRKEIDIREMNKDEYIAWNIQRGNIVVDAENGKVFATRGPGGVRLGKPKELSGSTVNGYKVVSIRNGATKLQCRIHRIVWIAVNGVVPDGYCIDHINNDKQDNRISNLQILTPSENSRKAKEDGLYKTGEDNKASKISPEIHDEIAYLYATDDFTMRELAEIYGISKSRISQIVREVGWTDIGDWTDSKGRTRKTSDAARYKALGNSIALPPWKWVLKRLCAEYERDATMGSLFDGIGGFPLIWEQINGKGSCLWASEIEEFCIAVTKRRFEG